MYPVCGRGVINEDMPVMSWVLTVGLPQRTIYPTGCFPSNNMWAIIDTVETRTWKDLGKMPGFLLPLLPAWVRPDSPEKLLRDYSAVSKSWEVLQRTPAECIPVHEMSQGPTGKDYFWSCRLKRQILGIGKGWHSRWTAGGGTQRKSPL